MSKHKCRFAAVQCIDFRFRKVTEEYLTQSFGTDSFDLYSWPGAAKKIADLQTRDTYMKDVAVCASLHSAERLLLVSHLDCGAYGGTQAFSSVDEEKKKLSADLCEARDYIRQLFPKLTVELVLLDTYQGNSFLKID